MVLMRSAIAVLALLMVSLGTTAAVAQQTPRAPVAPRAPEAPRAARAPLTFGFRLDPGPPLAVLAVMPGSPVEAAGIRAGDILVSVDGQEATIESVHSAARRASPGEAVRFRIRRDDRDREVLVVPRAGAFVYAPHPTPAPQPRGRERIVIIDPDSIRALTRLYLDGAREALKLYGELDLDLNLDLGELGDGTHIYRFHFDSLGAALREGLLGIEPQLRELGELHLDMPPVEVDFQGSGALPGARLTDLNDDLARYFPGTGDGILVLSVRSGSRADEAGLEAGDVIVEFDGEGVGELSELRGAFHRRDEPHTLEVVRRGERLTLRLPS
jgi:membrane-associated protease RseP (regulator of RpoE activity)